MWCISKLQKVHHVSVSAILPYNMRVLEPHYFQGSKKKRRSIKPLLLILLLIIVSGGGVYGLQLQQQKQKLSRVNKSAVIGTQQAVIIEKPKATPIVFTGKQFKELYRGVMQTYPNTEAFLEYPKITGNDVADVRIRSIAQKLGFQPTRMPVTALIKTNEPRLEGETDDLLQPLAYKHWLELKTAAEAASVPIALLSAYRSPEWQRDLFMQRLYGNGGDIVAIAAGVQDTVIEQTLGVTGVPGYSRHHTGYAVDFWCEDGSGTFGTSSCHTWLVQNNYLHAKEHGWMPSYPEDAGEQGPEPEPWEYVWVGRDVLYQ